MVNHEGLVGGTVGTMVSALSINVDNLHSIESIVAIVCTVLGLLITIITSVVIPLCRWYANSKKDGKIAKLYTENESKLLDQIKSTSTSTNRDSDVPQLDGDWDGYDQVSTVASASTESLVDNGSMMNRLSEIRSGYRDIMQLWMRDFYKNFLQEVLTW